MKIVSKKDIGFEDAVMAFFMSVFSSYTNIEHFRTSSSFRPRWSASGMYDIDVVAVQDGQDETDEDIFVASPMDAREVPCIVKGIRDKLESLGDITEIHPEPLVSSDRTEFLLRGYSHLELSSSMIFSALCTTLHLQPMAEVGHTTHMGMDVPIWWHPGIEGVRCRARNVDPLRAGVLGLLMLVTGISKISSGDKLVAVSA